MKFLRYYFSKILKTWLNLLFTLPVFIQKMPFLVEVFFGEKYKDFLNLIIYKTQQYNVALWLAGILFLSIHIKVIYSLYTNVGNTKSGGLNTGLPVSYKNILDEVSDKMPNISTKTNENLLQASKQLDKGSSVNLIIIKHYIAYQLIKIELDKLYNSTNSGLVVTPENSEIKARLYNNYSTLETWHEELHNSANTASFIEIKKLIDEINVDTHILLAEIRP